MCWYPPMPERYFLVKSEDLDFNTRKNIPMCSIYFCIIAVKDNGIFSFLKEFSFVLFPLCRSKVEYDRIIYE